MNVSSATGLIETCRRQALFLDIETKGRTLGSISELGVGSLQGEWVWRPRSSPGRTWLPWLHSWMARAVVIGHNLPFDLPHVARFFFKNGFSWPTIRIIDTLSLSRALLPQLSSHTLTSLTSTLRLPHPHPRTASGDVRATRSLWGHLCGLDPVRASTPLPLRL